MLAAVLGALLAAAGTTYEIGATGLADGTGNRSTIARRVSVR